ncbi:MAG: hypothetical protein M1835_007260, partial [Candelina submexicana]
MDTTSSGRGSRVVEGLIDPALGGGEEVRICNPCVPDPNFDPPPQRAPESVIHAPHGSSSSDDLSSSLDYPHSPIVTARRELERPRMRSHSSRQSHESISSPNASVHSRLQRFQDSRDEEALIRELRHRGGGPASTASFVSASEQRVPSPRFNVFVPEPQDHGRHSIYTPSVRVHRREPSNPNAGAAVVSSRYPNPSSSAPTSNYIPNVPPSSRHRQHASTSSSRSAVRSMLDIDTPPPRPRPRLREEDICPICHSALPPKGPDGSETVREQHVVDCISSHYSTSSPSRVELHPASSAATQTVMPAQASGDNNRDPQLQRPRVNHMLRYAATEKDCVGDNGEAQECVICFEEFAVGVDMARLE